MGKKAKQSASKAAVKAAKKQKQAKKVEQKSKKKQDAEGGEEDLLVTLAEFRKKWEEDHKVTEDVTDGPPSRRANANLTADPVNPYLWLFGGEFFDGANAYFYNDFYRYSPDKNEWRRFSSPSFPGPRSAHQMVATPAGGGKLWLFGGEFASLNQTSFHHYRDMWCFDISTSSWERIETRIKPSARSGHRMVAWKQWIILFGGFHDVGIRTSYLQDLWIFDTMEYKWHQVPTKETERWPSARSGFSFLAANEGVILHGGYCKKYISKTKFEGVPLDDTYFLRLDASGDWSKLKWEKRKRVGQVPSLRSGATMTTWANKQMGVGFGGVKDVEDEESLTSEFYQDLFGYQVTGNGRWVTMQLRKKKKPGGGKRKRKATEAAPAMNGGAGQGADVGSEDEDLDEEDREEVERLKREQAAREEAQAAKAKPLQSDTAEVDDDPEATIPLARYNTMLAVLRNTLYIYGGIYESGDRDYTLQSFFSLALDKMDRYICLRDDDIDTHEWNESESGSEDDDDSGNSSDDESDGEDAAAEEEASTAPTAKVLDERAEEDINPATITEQDGEAADLRRRAEAFMGVSKQAQRSEEDELSTPLPGETLATFYARSKQFWAHKAHESSDQRGKMLRREGFTLAEERYEEYKPLLQEIEKIQAEAGIEAADVQRRTGPGVSGVGTESRNRR